MAPSSTSRSEDAREKARQIAAKQSRTGTSASRRWLQISVIAVLVVIIAIIAVVYTQTRSTEIPDAGPVPSSANQYGGIVVTKDGIVKNASDVESRNSTEVQTGAAASSASAAASDDASAAAHPLGVATGKDASKDGKPVRVTLFQDYNCIHCANFEKSDGESIKEKVMSGEIELEIRNLNFLDQETTTQYSSRVANAAYAVAEQVDSEKFLDWQQEIFSHQGEGGLKDQEIEDISQKYGADVKDVLDSNTYRPMVNTTVAESQANGITGTPTVFVDGTEAQITDFSSALDTAIKDKKTA